jgi:hypothetical protein
MTYPTTFADAVRPLGQFAALLLSLFLLSACGGGGGGGGSSASLQLLADGTGSSSGVVGQPVDQVPGVRVLDGSGAPVSGAAVTFSVGQAGASVTPGTVNTGADGRARPTSWVLGTEAGLNSLVASVAGAAGDVRFTATAAPGPVAAILPASIQEQSGDTSQPVANPPAVRVTDAFDNPVPGAIVNFSVEQGGGLISSTSATSDADGIARLLSWTLGSELGVNEVSASITGVGSISFLAEGLPPLELAIEAVRLNQATQSAGADIAAVAGREGLLRVVVRASRTNSEAPDVLLRLFHDGAQLWERRLPAPGSRVPVDPVLGVLSQTWNIVLTPEEVQPGLAVEAILDPDEEIALASREGMRFPREAGQAPILVQELPPLRMLFIPVRATQHDATGEIFPATVEQFLTDTRLWLPVGALEGEVRSTPLVTDRDLTDIDEVSGLLSDLEAVRAAASAGDRYYHGIVPDIPGLPVAGIAYVPSSPSRFFRSGLSYDRLPGASETVAHELAHNLGREHSPCGDPDGVDPDYPYDGARIGATGYNLDDEVLVSATTFFDYMGYCQPRWTSDYTYAGILDWRLRDAQAFADGGADALADVLSEVQSGLLLWGRVNSDGVELNPGFALEAQPMLPELDGPHRLRGVAQDGSVLFDLAFGGAAVPHARDAAERHFAWFVPLSPAQLATLDRVELNSPYGSAQQSARRDIPADGVEQLADAAGVTSTMQRTAGGGLRIGWDTARNPVAMVRDRRSGAIVGIGRSGELSFDTVSAAAIDPEVLLSDGLRTRREIPQEVR